jgi:hypothetical protein
VALAWKPILHFSFENEAALDETGNGFHGRVELPARDRWIHRPVPQLATAIRFDDPESKIVVATVPAFAGWRGLRVRSYFRTGNLSRRLNLVEGDGSFALFLEPGGVLCGTINDGSASWWGVATPSGSVVTDRWHLAELIYDAGQVIALSLDGRLMGIRLSAGLPIRSVGPAGIRIGYWPGGDSRFTFDGLLGPVWIDRLDEREPAVGIVNKLMCHGSKGTSRLERLDRILREELTAQEQAAVREFGRRLNEALKRLMAVILGQAAAPAPTLNTLTDFADDLGRLLSTHEAAGTDAWLDPALGALAGKVYAAACAANPGAPSALFTEAFALLSASPLPAERWSDILRRHPDLCATACPPLDLSGAGGPWGWIDSPIARLCRDGPKGPTPTPGGDCGCGRTHAPRTAGGKTVHVHVHCADAAKEMSE